MDLFHHKLLSLVDLSVRRLVANVFTESSVLLSISNTHNKYWPYDADDYELKNLGYEIQLNIEKDWEETVEVKLWEEISKLGLPNELMQKVNDIVVPMGRQVKKWKEFHEKYLCIANREPCYFDVPILQKLRWTALGTVDYRKTALEIVSSDVLGIVKKFKLACLYCLEDYIPIFWRELPTRNKKYFHRTEEWCLRTGGLGLEFWWPYITQGQESELDGLTRSYRADGVTFRQYAFHFSVRKGNKAAAEHFLQQLTDEEKRRSLVSAAKSIEKQSRMSCSKYWIFPVKKCFELLGYLLSIMTENQQMQILRDIPLAVLEGFLIWPWQDMFSKIVRKIARILPVQRLDAVLFFMYENFERFGENSQVLFQEFFLYIHDNLPVFWLDFVNRQSVPRSYFGVKFVNRGVKPLEICFRSLDAVSRKRLIFSMNAINAFKKFLSEGKPEAVEACLQDVSLSKTEKNALKVALRVREIQTRKRSGLVKLLADDS